jgi:HEAT repeat protein
MPDSLPDRPSLEHLKHEAKALLKSHRAGDPAVCQALRGVARLRGASDEAVLASRVSLQEVQHALALQYGFRSWKELKDRIARQTELAALRRGALDVFTSSGPERNSTRSSWERRRQAETEKLLAAGDEGFSIMRELARADSGRLRNAAAICFAQSEDERTIDELRALLHDPAATVRSRAARFYASRIHPAGTPGSLPRPATPADRVPEGVADLLPLVRDASTKVRLDAIGALSAYARIGDARVTRALRGALGDSRHKVRHAAARALGVACPGCGEAQGGEEGADPGS